MMHSFICEPSQGKTNYLLADIKSILILIKTKREKASSFRLGQQAKRGSATQS